MLSQVVVCNDNDQNDNADIAYLGGTTFAISYSKFTAGIGVIRLTTDLGTTFGDEIPIANASAIGLTRLRDGSLLSVNTTGHVWKSTDSGLTWRLIGIAKNGFTDPYNGGSSRIMECDDGSLLMPIFGKNTGDTYISAHAMRSTDGGVTWDTEIVVANGERDHRDYDEWGGCNLGGGKILAIIRDDAHGQYFWQTISTDNGLTWPIPSVSFEGSGTPKPNMLLNNRVGVVYRHWDVSTLEWMEWAALRFGTISEGVIVWDAEIRLDANDWFCYYGSVAQASNGTIGTAWAEQRVQGFPAGKFDIYFRTISEPPPTITQRFRYSGKVNKPLPPTLVSELPVIKSAITDLQRYARKTNEGKANEESTSAVSWGNETDCIWWVIDLAIPSPMPQSLQDRLPAIKDTIKLLKKYSSSPAKVHICGHNTHTACREEQDI